MNAISIPDRQPQRWRLKIRAWPVLTINGTPTSIDCVHNYPALLPHDTIRINLQYDSNVLADLALERRLEHEVLILDDKITTDHELTVSITHKEHGHHIEQDTSIISICVACEMLIEDLVVSHMITGGGMILLGQNAHPIRFNIETPIYRWLLDRRHSIYRTYNPDPVASVVLSYA